MRRLISAALGAAVLALVAPGTIQSALAAPQTQAAGTSGAMDAGARRHNSRHDRRYSHHRVYDQPVYYARPNYYRSYPYNTPAPFTFGFGFGPFR